MMQHVDSWPYAAVSRIRPRPAIYSLQNRGALSLLVELACKWLPLNQSVATNI
jgi:hypothetical protein